MLCASHHHRARGVWQCGHSLAYGAALAAAGTVVVIGMLDCLAGVIVVVLPVLIAATPYHE